MEGGERLMGVDDGLTDGVLPISKVYAVAVKREGVGAWQTPHEPRRALDVVDVSGGQVNHPAEPAKGGVVALLDPDLLPAKNL